VLGSSKTVSNGYKYLGKYGVIADNDAHLYISARYYSPELGRFVKTDFIKGGITNPLTLNRYRYTQGNPVNYSDLNGNWALIDDIIAGAVGAVIGVGGQLASDVVTSVVDSVQTGTFTFTLSDGEKYVGAAIGGATGGVASLYVGPIIGSGIGGAVSGATTDMAYMVTGDEERNWSDVATSAGIGAATGLAGGFAGKYVKVKGITSGRSSYATVFKSGITKIQNGTAESMSFKILGKGIASGLVVGTPGSILGGTTEGLTNDISSEIPKKRKE